MDYALKRKASDRDLSPQFHWMATGPAFDQDISDRGPILEAREADLIRGRQATARALECPQDLNTSPKDGQIGSGLIKWDPTGTGNGPIAWVDRCVIHRNALTSNYSTMGRYISRTVETN